MQRWEPRASFVTHSSSDTTRRIDDVDELKRKSREFARERDWEQFHSPRNLAAALIVEAAELLEHFQWLSASQSRQLEPEELVEVGDEIGDVLIYLVRLSDELGIDPLEAAGVKLEKNAVKSPAEKVSGSIMKYDEYSE